MDETDATRTPSTWLASLLVGSLSLALGLITLGKKSFWYDEAFDGVRIRGTVGSVLHLITGTEMSQAAYLAFLKVWARAVPDTDVWLRLPSVVAAALAVALVVPLGARLADRNTGVVAGLLLATHELVVRWSQQARTYALVTLAVVLVALLFVRALDDPRRRNWLLYGFVAGLSVYCHFFAGFVVVALFASLPFAPRRPPLRYIVESGVVFVAVTSLALYFTATAPRSQISYIPEPSIALLRDVMELTIGHNFLLAAAALAGIVVLALRRRRGDPGATWLVVLLAGWIVLPIMLPLILSFRQPILNGRYLIVVAPALALAGAIAITSLWQARRSLAVLVLAAVIVAAGLRIVHWYELDTENWRAAVAYVNSERASTDDVVVAPVSALHGLRYYDGSTEVRYRPIRRRTFIYLWGYDRADRAESLRTAIGGAKVTKMPERPFGNGLGVVVVEPRR
jgi:mannosyltransferase